MVHIKELNIKNIIILKDNEEFLFKKKNSRNKNIIYLFLEFLLC